MLTWKQIKESVEKDHPIHKLKDEDLVTYLIVHLDTVAFGVVGQDGFAVQTNHNKAAEWINEDFANYQRRGGFARVDGV